MTSKDAANFVGSDSWIGADAYEPGDEFHERATAFLVATRWDLLESLSSRLRNGMTCKFDEQVSIGHLLRRIVFADGISWAARLRLPQLKSVFSDGEFLDVSSILRVE